jgi:C_GCAxxG_C_C family probable redox protein
VLAVGEYLWGAVDDQVLRMSSALAGGVGCSHEEVCGTLSGGAMILGVLYGRTRPEQNDDELKRLVCLFRDRFIAEFGYSRCGDLQASGFGDGRTWPCSAVGERAVRVLMGVLEETEG